MVHANRLNLMLAGVLVAAVAGSAWLARRGDEPAPLPLAPAPGPGPTIAAAPAAVPAVPDPPRSAALEAASAAVAAQDWKQARKILESIPAADAAYPSALYNLGILHDQAGDHEAARAVFERLTRLQPENPDAWVSYGWTLYRLQDLDGAERTTLRALELQFDSVPARYNLGLYRAAAGRTEEAIQSYERAFRVDQRQAGYAAALKDLREHIERAPERSELRFVLAFFFKVVGEYGLETVTLESFLASAPQGPLFDAASSRIETAREQARERGLLVPKAEGSPGPTPSPSAP